MDFPDLLALVVSATTRGVTKAFDNTWSAGAALMGSVPMRGEALHLHLKMLLKKLSTGHSKRPHALTARSFSLIVRPSGRIVNSSRSRASAPSGVSSATMSNSRSSIATASLISSSAM